MAKRLTVPFFFDFKSPFSFLAKDPLRQLRKGYDIKIDYLPFEFSRLQPNIFIPDLREDITWTKIRYMYKDCRRFANERDPPIVIKGPQKLFDSSCANIGGLFCLSQSEVVFEDYMDFVFEKFFRRELAIDNEKDMAEVIDMFGKKHGVDSVCGESYRSYLHGEGKNRQEEIHKLGDSMGIFGVPSIFVEDEMFFGNDRMHFVEKRLKELDLKKSQ